MHILDKIKQDNLSECLKDIEMLQCKVSFANGRKFILQGYEGSVTYNEAVEAIYQKAKMQSFSPDAKKSYAYLQTLHDKGEEELEKANIITKTFTLIKRLFTSLQRNEKLEELQTFENKSTPKDKIAEEKALSVNDYLNAGNYELFSSFPKLIGKDYSLEDIKVHVTKGGKNWRGIMRSPEVYVILEGKKSNFFGFGQDAYHSASFNTNDKETYHSKYTSPRIDRNESKTNENLRSELKEIINKTFPAWLTIYNTLEMMSKDRVVIDSLLNHQKYKEFQEYWKKIDPNKQGIRLINFTGDVQWKIKENLAEIKIRFTFCSPHRLYPKNLEPRNFSHIFTLSLDNVTSKSISEYLYDFIENSFENFLEEEFSPVFRSKFQDGLCFPWQVNDEETLEELKVLDEVFDKKLSDLFENKQFEELKTELNNIKKYELIKIHPDKTVANNLTKEEATEKFQKIIGPLNKALEVVENKLRS